MTRTFVGGIFATVAVLVVGVAIALPPFLQPPRGPPVMLAFSIINENNDVPYWCSEVSDILKKNNLDAVVFFSGIIAENHPQCVASFGENVDIGSSTYNYGNLTAIADYSEQLKEILDGKNAVDLAGDLNSKSFRAPYGSTDENIYSLLARSEILADFSYTDRYHKYHEGNFIWFRVTVYNASSISGAFIRDLQYDENDRPIQIDIDNTVPLSKVQEIVDALKDKRANFLNASELTGIELTVRGGRQ
ncbi:putative polysaccharide deacetylase family protein [Candidatus Nitrososphaera gargensis Ga9.2]|uniref:Putative polysaccharide deacetylase family protein n=1 Tax=Nitrososphaera gargensis (strain Ga9.2) TaxID=1237085 RepID=K0INU1_NITGG|nr:polysaccharide deacetylase family protein [Candidatus Nitrososphaera gargensis]AFU59964.1 putative polysaccharide deacetylase family protein [Candidatus Nitrososphaera gargensis Ga9.2]